MSPFRRVLPILLTGIASILVTTSASNALTAEEVWTYWQEAAVSGDHPLKATTIRKSGKTLELDGLATSLTLGKREINLSIDSVRLREEEDGSVAVLFSEKPQILVSAGGRTARLEFASQDLFVRVSGVPQALKHDLQADRLEIDLDARSGIGEGDVPFDINLDLGRISTTYLQKSPKEGTVSVEIGSLDASLQAEYGTSGKKLASVLHLESIVSSADLFDFADVDASNLATRIEAGSKFSWTVEATKAGYELTLSSGEDPSETDSLRAVLGLSSLGASLAPEGMKASFLTSGVQAALNGFDLPAFSGNLDRMTMALELPVLPSETGSSALLQAEISGLALDPDTWNLVDPKGALEHAPMRLKTDMSALVKPLRNLVDVLLGERQTFPLEVLNAELRTFEVEALGMQAQGSGSMGFDPADLESFNGFPKPQGVIDLTLSGVDKGLEAFGAAGLLGDQELSAARFFLALFMTPADPAGTFTTRIEATDEGSILANGQRIR